MSFDLILWFGSPPEPSRHWSEITRDETAAGLLPRERLLAAFRSAFDGDVRVSPTPGHPAVELRGRGWECTLTGPWPTVVCDGSVANDPSAIARFARAAHDAECSLYDPQLGAYWPAAIGLPDGCEDAWAAAAFDQGFVYEDEDDEEGHVPSTPMRLYPDGARPMVRDVSIYAHVAEQGPLLRELVSRRAALYRERFPGWTITVELGGPGVGDLERRDVLRWLKATDAKPAAEPRADRPSTALVVLGDFDTREIAARLSLCPFELVPIPEEARTLASCFDEPVVALAVIVPARVVARASEVLRAALRELHDALASQAGGAPLYFADPARAADADVGANLAWVEALLGLTPSEPIRAVAAADVPRVRRVTDEDDDGIEPRQDG